jgi:hypothetical protein
MNYNTGYIGLASIDGQAYPSITQKGLKDIFESCYVPMDDGNKVLVQPDRKTISQRGYGNVVKRKPVKVPSGNRPGITNQDVITRHNTNVSVYTDFPKGAGSKDTQIAWRDGTYDEAVLSATRKPRGEVPDQTFADILSNNPRWSEYALASQTGANVFGNIQVAREVAKAIADQESIGKSPAVASLIRDLAEAGVPLVDIRRITEFMRSVNRDRYAREIASDIGITNQRLIEELGNILPVDRDVSSRASREAIKRFIQEQRRQERNQDMAQEGTLPAFMPGAPPPAPMSPADMRLLVEREIAQRQYASPSLRNLYEQQYTRQTDNGLGRSRDSVARINNDLRIGTVREPEAMRMASRGLEFMNMERRGQSNPMFPGVRSRGY